MGCAVDGISWIDLNSAEQHAIAVLGAGFSAELCNALALVTLKRAGLVRGSFDASSGTTAESCRPAKTGGVSGISPQDR
jgi:hypothetical protein